MPYTTPESEPKVTAQPKHLRILLDGINYVIRLTETERQGYVVDLILERDLLSLHKITDTNTTGYIDYLSDSSDLREQLLKVIQELKPGTTDIEMKSLEESMTREQLVDSILEEV